MINVENLEKGNVIIVKLEKDFLNIVELSSYTVKSYENLFASYINNTTEEANKFNLDRFLDKYTSAKLQSEQVQYEVVENAMGKEEYKYLRDNYIFSWTFDNIADAVLITIQGVKGRK